MTLFRRWLLALVVLNLAARLPLCWDPATVRNDGAEYLAIARSLRTTSQYATDLKYDFYTDDPIRHPALGDRSPGFPAFAVLAQRALPFLTPTAGVRVANCVLCSLALVLAAAYLKRLFDERTALLAVGFCFLLPHSVYWTAQPMTEALSLVLSFAALLAWNRAAANSADSCTRSDWVVTLATGLLVGLAYLVRPTGALLGAAFLVDALLPAEAGKVRAARCLVVPLALGFLLTAAPYHWLLWKQYGSPFYSSLAYTFAVANYYEVTYFGFERQRLTATQFLRAHWAQVPALIATQAWNHAQSILLPLAAFLPFSLGLRASSWQGARRPAAVLVLLTLVVHTVTWSAWGSQRYFLLCLPLLAAALLAAAPRAALPGWGKKLLLAAALGGLSLFLTGFYRREMAPDHGVSSMPSIRRAVVAAGNAGVVASDRPALLNLLLERPTVMLPRTADRAQLTRFVARFQPDVLILFIEEPQKRAAETMATAWRNGGLPAAWRLAEDDEKLLVARCVECSQAPRKPDPTP